MLAAMEVGGSVESVLDGLAGFEGVRRRFESVGTAAGVRVFDDYAHHPTEVEATLLAARAAAEGGRVIVAFQPHRYSRTAAFATELGTALVADTVSRRDPRTTPVGGGAAEERSASAA